MEDILDFVVLVNSARINSWVRPHKIHKPQWVRMQQSEPGEPDATKWTEGTTHGPKPHGEQVKFLLLYQFYFYLVNTQQD